MKTWTPTKTTALRPSAAVVLRRLRSTRLERLLVGTSMALVAFQNRVAPFGRLSIVWVAFALIGVTVVARSPGTVFRVALHRCMAPIYLFISIAFLMEFPHPTPSWAVWSRVLQMVLGAVLIVSICRDRAAMRAALHGLLVGGTALAVMFVVVSYGPFSSTSASSFHEITQLRAKTVENTTLQIGINSSGFLMAMSAAIATAFSLTATAASRRYVYAGLALLNGLATLLSLSRGGILAAAVAISVVLGSYNTKRIRTLVGVGLALGLLVLLAPPAVFHRLSARPTATYVDPRERIYATAYRQLPEFALTGVGAGNFRGQWGFEHGFAEVNDFRRTDPRKLVTGAHNTPLQIFLNWGVVALASFFAVLWRLYRRLPSLNVDLEASLLLRGAGAAILADMMVSHSFYGKHYSAVLGLLLAPTVWWWHEARRPSHPGDNRHSHLPKSFPAERETLQLAGRLSAVPNIDRCPRTQ